MRRRNLYAAAVTLALSVMSASGATILEIGVATAARGSTGNTLEVDITNTGPSSIVIGGFNFEISADTDIDFTGAGFSTSAPYIFAGDSFDQAIGAPLNSSTGSSLSAGDISNSGNGHIVGAGQTAGLALVTFNVSPTAAPGPVIVSFSTDPSNSNLSDRNGISVVIDSFVSGTVNLVPEPSAAAMLLTALMVLVAWRAAAGKAGRIRG